MVIVHSYVSHYQRVNAPLILYALFFFSYLLTVTHRDPIVSGTSCPQQPNSFDALQGGTANGATSTWMHEARVSPVSTECEFSHSKLAVAVWGMAQL